MASLGWAARLEAGERATLSNGFAMECNHHGLVDGRVRLYLSPGEDSYIEMGPQEVTSFEIVPDPPREPATMPGSRARLSPADLHEMLAAAGQAHNLDIDLLASVVKAESAGNTRAVSHSGAAGLMQLMPSTASDLGVTDRLRPEDNLRGGSAYLDQMLRRYHENLAMALAAYNAGPAAVDKYHGIPPYRETKAYVARVIHEFNRRVRARDARPSANPQAVSSNIPPPQ
jgi:Transglycosylase SLT domain